MVSAATLTAVRASISTPVRSLARAVATMPISSSPTSNSTLTEVRLRP
jgi:hypothetical protein